MSDTYKDPIVDGLHETRHAIHERHGDDFASYMSSIAERKIPGVKYVATAAYANCNLPKVS